MNGVITFTTDFGRSDGFPAQMKGVILGINPGAVLVDVTHDVASFSVIDGALVLKGAWGWFPEGTVHVAVVDPGVGTARRALAVRFKRHFFVGPDNGLLTSAAPPDEGAEYRSIENPHFMLSNIHPTFHGRDVFAPAAARLSLGERFERVGPQIEDPVRLQIPKAARGPCGVEGEIIRIDHFGNLTSNIDETMLTDPVGRVRAGTASIQGMSRCFGERRPGEALALINSSGFLEIAIHCGNAADVLGLVVGDKVSVEWE
jgi:S-adenosylmethionine hydrolase